MGIDPGTNNMGYGVLAIEAGKPRPVILGDIDLHKISDPYRKLAYIFERVSALVEEYNPDEVALESPFFGENVQSMLKLGRAQGVAMAAALSRDVPITEYEPRKIKMAITGNGAASKEQVRDLLCRILDIKDEELAPQLDATDALGAALCHFYESSKPISTGGAKSWKAFIASNPDRVKK